MATLVRRNSNCYSKMEKEDPQERSHREAQFLIYKTMKQADQIVRRSSSRPSWLRLRICKLKVRIGKRLIRLRKTMLSSMAKTKVGVCKNLMGHLKSFERLFNGVSGSGRGGGTAINHLPQPLFTCTLE